MPERLNTYLGSLAGLMLVAYLALVIGTIFLANVQTELADSVSDAEASIGALETQYYAAIASVNAEDPATFGFVVPAKKEYARAAASLPTLTRAGE
jgi:hypothetical protein